MRPIKIRNSKRAVWFFPFEVSEEVAAIARGDGRGRDGEAVPVVGLDVKTSARRRRKGSKIETVDVQVCTLALGDAQAHESEPAPDLTIPGEVWAALMADPVQGRAVEGLRRSGEISVYSDIPAGS